MDCAICSSTITKDPVLCCGNLPYSKCKAAFHPECIKIAAACVKEMARNRGLCWMCEKCRESRADFVSFISGLMCDLKNEMINELFHELDKRFTHLPSSKLPSTKPTNTASSAPKQTGIPTTSLLTVNAYHTDPDNIESSTPESVKLDTISRTHPSERTETSITEFSHPALHIGTSNDLTMNSAIQFIPAPEPKTWIFITRVAPKVTEESMKTFIQGRLNCTNCSVKRILPNGRDPNALTYISFKVGVPSELKEIALSPTTWPCGFVYREFNFRPRAPKISTPYSGFTLRTALSSISCSGTCENKHYSPGHEFHQHYHITTAVYFLLDLYRGHTNKRCINNRTANKCCWQLFRITFFTQTITCPRRHDVSLKDPFYIFYQNARGLRTKNTECFTSTAISEWDGIVLTET
uniref:uncharacterized protein LOC125907476 n=1 Tax=Anopheles coluzzii TaxID=1518534 RepID=UPI0020FF7EF7|nr:uncharacterized protein LOC125907476 [Anopheles coluzzii]XP_049466039.1 uncharacterized protein LOC125907476 [Anopheles coluzzii]